MVGPEVAVGIIIILIFAVVCSIPVVLALGLTSFFGLAYITGSLDIAGSLLANTTYEAIRDYVFAVIPLFVLMGEFISRSGAAADLYKLVNRSFKRLPGRLALATVAGNAVFGAVTGVSIASAAAFSRIAYPEMARHGYNKAIALGSIAGSASLGMLIPPSILLIVWGVISEQSIGQLFVAGVIPGIILAGLFFLFIIAFAFLRPDLFGQSETLAEDETGSARSEILGGIGVLILIVAVLGGIWVGAFTPTEAAGVGALMALVLALMKGVTWSELAAAVLETGRISAPLLFLLITAQMYSRLLALGGVTDFIQSLFIMIGDHPGLILLIMVLVWFVLGMFIDSVSIILLTVPIFAPLAASAGYDPLAFAIIGIVAIEAGLLTPPLGLCVYTVKGCVTDPDATLTRIFVGAIPYWIILLLLVLILAVMPSVATWLPSQML
jgi:tripartite ATP-independent transporter DctM subunit